MFKLICRLPKWMGGGHKRGKRVPDDHQALLLDGVHVFECQRCGERWSRKIRKAKA